MAAFFSYRAIGDNYFPERGNMWSPGTTWYSSLHDYAGIGYASFNCPEEKSRDIRLNESGPYKGKAQNNYYMLSCYAIWSNLAGQTTTAVDALCRRSKISPSKLVVVKDGAGFFSSNNLGAAAAVNTFRAAFERHDNAVNTGFLDGHAASHKIGDFNNSISAKQKWGKFPNGSYNVMIPYVY